MSYLIFLTFNLIISQIDDGMVIAHLNVYVKIYQSLSDFVTA